MRFEARNFFNCVGRAFAFGLALYISASVASSSAAEGSLPDFPVVSTIAGTGVAGHRDGPAGSATFAGPQGMAYDKHGNLIVADTPSQRIRELTKDGQVRTIAGSGTSVLFGTAVAGGYHDGSALTAQFNQPEAVAVDASGTVYIADTGNHCIRILKDGVVSTLAGNPSRIGKQDGPAVQAAFTNPRGIAVDNEGNVYVADPPNGIRKISPNGIVSTLDWKYSDAAWSVATYQSGTTSHLIAATPRQIAVYDLNTKNVVEIETEQLYYLFPPREGAEFLGPPSSVAEVSPTEFIFADDLLSTIHLVQLGAVDQVRVLSEQPLLNAGNRGGGYRDGPGDQALFDQPMGIAADASGKVAVADTGNKRIRLLSPFNRRSFAVDGTHLPDAPSAMSYRIAILGNSYVWTNVPWHLSLDGLLQRRLTSLHLTRRNIEVYPIRQDGVRAGPELSYAQQMLTNDLFNCVVVFLPTYGQFTTKGDLQVSTDPSYDSDIRAGVAQLRKSLQSQGIHLTVVLFPGAFDMPNEMTYRKFFEQWRDPGKVQEQYQRALADLKSTGVDYLDLWPAFFAADRSTRNIPLFGAWDHHFTYQGNALVAKLLAEHLRAEGALGH